MSNDRQVITFMSPAELVALMNQTGIIAVHESSTSDGKPVIHAALKVVNSHTGEHLPGGLPFSVVMFKGPDEAGYSNLAIGTIVPASELKVALPRDYFNFCNQRFRFTRCFPVDERSFVIQMDLVVRNATREYVKFSLGLWGALYSQMLFELIGRGRESLIAAAEAFAEAKTDFAEHIASSPETSDATHVVPDAEPLPVEAIVPATVAIVAVDAEGTALALAEPPVPEEVPVAELPVEEVLPEAPLAEEPVAVAPKDEETEAPACEAPAAAAPPAEEAKAEEPVVEVKPEESVEPAPAAEEAAAEEPKPEELKADEPKAEETKAEEPKAEEPKVEEPIAEAELSIVAGPAAVDHELPMLTLDEQVAELAGLKRDAVTELAATENPKVLDVMPGY